MSLTSTSAVEIEKRTGARSGLIEIAGNQIYFEAAGQGRPIVFLHDGILDSRVFDHQFAEFARDYTVIRYDRQGYGASKAPSVAYSEIDTLRGLFEHLGLETAVLIGGSGGGGIALDFVIAHPACVAALVLAGAPISGLGFSEHMQHRGWRQEWGEGPAGFIEFWVNDPWLTAEENSGARARLRLLLESAAHSLANFTVEALPAAPALPHLSEVQAPTLILVGESDIADNHAHAGVLQAGIRGSERIVMVHAGHLVYLEQPERFNQLVHAFLAQRVS